MNGGPLLVINVNKRKKTCKQVTKKHTDRGQDELNTFSNHGYTFLQDFIFMILPD